MLSYWGSASFCVEFCQEICFDNNFSEFDLFKSIFFYKAFEKYNVNNLELDDIDKLNIFNIIKTNAPTKEHSAFIDTFTRNQWHFWDYDYANILKEAFKLFLNEINKEKMKVIEDINLPNEIIEDIKKYCDFTYNDFTLLLTKIYGESDINNEFLRITYKQICPYGKFEYERCDVNADFGVNRKEIKMLSQEETNYVTKNIKYIIKKLNLSKYIMNEPSWKLITILDGE